MAKRKLRWGILGCGHIAGAFADDLVHSRTGELYAVASRSAARARRFARDHGAAVARGSYRQLVEDPDVDVVYVATPHPCHLPNVLLALEAGKPVLCEKPITLNARQLQTLIRTARRRGLFLMEGMWTRFFPATVRLRKWLAEERIGQVLALQADFGVRFKVGPRHRIYNPALGGGALLDLGIYPVSFASMVYGAQPTRILSAAHFYPPTGVDDHAALVFQYEQGGLAQLSCASRVVHRQEARIYGSRGRIIVHENFYRPHRLTLQLDGRSARTVTLDHVGHGFHFEADHVGRCLARGVLQSDIMPLEESLAVMRTMDRIRRQWKLRYPDE